MGDLLLPAEQAILLGNLPLECDLIPGAVLFSRLCTCVGKSHLYLAQEPLSITELVLVKHQQELISGQLSVPDSKTQLKMLFLPNLCSFQMGSPVLAKGLPSRLLRSSLVPLLAAARVHGGKTSLALVAGFADKKKLVPETSATATLALISVVSIIAWLQSNLLFTKILQGTGRCSRGKNRNWQRRVDPTSDFSGVSRLITPGNQSPEAGQSPGLLSPALEQMWPVVALCKQQGQEVAQTGTGLSVPGQNPPRELAELAPI